MLKNQRDQKLSKRWLLRNLAGAEGGYKEQYQKDEKASRSMWLARNLATGNARKQLQDCKTLH